MCIIIGIFSFLEADGLSLVVVVVVVVGGFL